jgi:hypothetical protein
VKIGDYGLSKFISVSRHSAQTASVGTVHYMAPEIGSGNYSRGVDIYALGVMLYEMLLGKVPFEGSSMAEVLMKHLTAQPELDELPGPFGKVIRKALEKDPKDRYQTAEEMLDDLLSGEEIQRSLAGFSTKSLEGAVRIGGRDRLDSPIPSPNPPPRAGRGFAQPGSPVFPGGPPPRSGAEALPDRLAKKLDRISHKIDRKMAKLAGKRGWNVPPPSPGAASGDPADIPWAQPAPPRGERGKRIVLLGMLLVGLSVGLGIWVGAASRSFGGERGSAAGMLVVALYGGVLLGRKASAWFSVQDGPSWAQRLVRACCAAPLLAIACAPIFDVGGGLPVWVGLLASAAFADWEKLVDDRLGREISVGQVFSKALGALVLTAIAAGLTDYRRPEKVMFISAGAAAAVALVLQAGAALHGHRRWAMRAAAGGAGVPRGGTASGTRIEGASGTHPTAAPVAPAVPADSWTAAPATPEVPSGEVLVDPHGRRPRGGFARMYWSVVAFVVMGGAIVTFVYSLIATPANPHDMTTAVIACTGFAAIFVFALRKATPLKRPGFWRESLRPFLISASLLGIGGTTTGIAREWNHEHDPCAAPGIHHSIAIVDRQSLKMEMKTRVREARAKVIEAFAEIPASARPMLPLDEIDAMDEVDTGGHRACLSDEGRVALVAGLVMSSLMFLGLTFFTGGKPRAPRGPLPFLRESGSDGSAASERTSGGAGSASVDATAAGE